MIFVNFSKEHNFKYFILFFFIVVIFGSTTSILTSYYDPKLTSNPVNDSPIYEHVLLGLFLAPLFETLIFQYFIIEIMFRLKARPLQAVFISALLFGLSHPYNLIYVLVTIVFGFVYSLYYVLLRSQGGGYKFWLVALLHSSWNLVALLNNRFFQ